MTYHKDIRRYEMNIGLYSIYDRKSKVYSNIFSCLNDNVAWRQFSISVNTDDNMMSLFPADYQLVRVGYFDNIDCKLIPEEHGFEIIVEGAAIFLTKEERKAHARAADAARKRHFKKLQKEAKNEISNDAQVQ